MKCSITWKSHPTARTRPRGSFTTMPQSYHPESSYQYSSRSRCPNWCDDQTSRRIPDFLQNQHQSDVEWIGKRFPPTPIPSVQENRAFRPISRRECWEEFRVSNAGGTTMQSDAVYPYRRGVAMRPIPEPAVRPYVYSRPPNSATVSNRSMDAPGRNRSNPSTQASLFHGLRIRGAEETWHAIQRDFYLPCPCSHCETTVFSIADAAYVLCPICEEVSPLDQESSSTMAAHGLGLGFTVEQLAQFQAKIAAASSS